MIYPLGCTPFFHGVRFQDAVVAMLVFCDFPFSRHIPISLTMHTTANLSSWVVYVFPLCYNIITMGSRELLAHTMDLTHNPRAFGAILLSAISFAGAKSSIAVAHGVNTEAAPALIASDLLPHASINNNLLTPSSSNAEARIANEAAVLRPEDGIEPVTEEMVERYTGLATQLALARFVPTPSEGIFQPQCVGERKIRILPERDDRRPEHLIGTDQDQVEPIDMRTALDDPKKTVIVAAGRYLIGTCTTDYINVKNMGAEGDNELCTTVVEEEMHKTGIRSQEPGRSRDMPYPLKDTYHDIYDINSPIYIGANPGKIPECLRKTVDTERHTTDYLTDVMSREKMPIYTRVIDSEDDTENLTCENVRSLESICYVINEHSQKVRSGRYIRFKSHYTSLGEIQLTRKPQIVPKRVLSRFAKDGKHAIASWLGKQRNKKVPTTQ